MPGTFLLAITGLIILRRPWQHCLVWKRSPLRGGQMRLDLLGVLGVEDEVLAIGRAWLHHLPVAVRTHGLAIGLLISQLADAVIIAVGMCHNWGGWLVAVSLPALSVHVHPNVHE